MSYYEKLAKQYPKEYKRGWREGKKYNEIRKRGHRLYIKYWENSMNPRLPNEERAYMVGYIDGYGERNKRNPASIDDGIAVAIDVALESGYIGTAKILSTIPHVKRNITEAKITAINAILAAIVTNKWRDIDNIINDYYVEEQDNYDNILYDTVNDLVMKYGEEAFSKQTKLNNLAKELIIELEELGYPKISIAEAKRKLTNAIYALV